MSVFLSVQQHRLIGIPHCLVKVETGEVELTAAGVEPRQGKQVLDDVSHPVGLVQNHSQEISGHLRGHIPQPLLQRFGIAANVGQRGTQLVGYIGHKVLAHLLSGTLFGDIVNEHQHAPLVPPGEGGK